jgi:3-oxoacyl-[acyl-carrier protein] reductase
MNWTLGLEQRGVVITGGAGDIGAEVARAFAAAGARVAVIDLDQSAAEQVVAGLEQPKRHRALAADMRDLAGHDRLFEFAEAEFGRVDTLAHLAAVLVRRPSVEDVTEADWDAQADVNLKATFFLNRAAARSFRKQGRAGRIVNFASQGWWSGGYGGSVVYAATKGGVVSLTRGLARAFAPDNITVNAVAPGGVDTTMMRGGLSASQLEDFTSMVPLGRLGTAAEMAGIVAFLASDHAAYITGATINVSGGQLMY